MEIPQVKVNSVYDNITDQLKASIKTYIELNISGKMDSYFKKVSKNHPDAEILIDISIKKNKQGLFDGSFRLHITSHKPITYQRDGFSDVNELVNHAFDHFKEQLSH